MLDELSRDILAFERTWWQQSGTKERAIRERFSMSATRYYQLLNELVDSDLAYSEDPMLIRRLRRQRAARQRQRQARRMGLDG